MQRNPPFPILTRTLIFYVLNIIIPYIILQVCFCHHNIFRNNYIYNNYDYLAISTNQALRQDVKVKYGKQSSISTIVGNDLSLWVPKNTREKALQIKLTPKSSTIEAPIKQGETVGDYQITIAGNLGFIDGSTDLKTKALAANSVEGINILIKWWQMLSDAI